MCVTVGQAAGAAVLVWGGSVVMLISKVVLVEDDDELGRGGQFGGLLGRTVGSITKVESTGLALTTLQRR